MNLFATTLLLGNLVISGTAPSLKDPDCTGAYASPYLTNPTLTIVVGYFGIDNFGWGVSTLKVKPGQPFVIARSVPPGLYQVEAHAAFGQLVGCDTTIVVHTSSLPVVVNQ